jgi:membrane protease YdiL (CAAX protease family)
MNASMILAFPLLWAVGAAAAYWYSQDRGIPWATALAALPAFLLEVSFYYVLGVERLRARLERLPPAGVAASLTVAAVLPYCAASLALRSFHWGSLAWIAVLAAAAAFWYVLFPRRAASDILFLLFIAVVVLLRIFPRLYPSPNPKLPLAVLGQLMWFRTGLFAMLSVRRVRNIGFGFWPAPREWKIGALYFALLLPVAGVFAWFMRVARPHLEVSAWERTTVLAVATFFGTLWVLALGEEFFFRGLLQQWVTEWLKSEWAGLILTSLLFGAAHLWFRVFPNWRLAAVAAVAGLFYGLAFRQAKSIRASMVTHALTVTTWRIFFS